MEGEPMRIYNAPVAVAAVIVGCLMTTVPAGAKVTPKPTITAFTASPVDELATADDRIGTVGSVPDPGMDKSEALAGFDVEGLSVVRGRLSHS